MSKVVAITRKQIAENYIFSEIVDAVENGYKLLHDGKIIVPPRFFSETRDGGDYMYGAATNLEKETILSLCSAYMPWNAKANLPIVRGEYLYISFKTGDLLAIVEGIDIVGLRTAAKSVVAAKYLAKKNPKTLGLIGLGVQAKMHAEAFCNCLGIERIIGYSRTPEKWGSTFEYVKSKTGKDIEVMTREEVIKNADIIVVATHSKEPLVNFNELKPGQLLISLDHAQSIAQDIIEKANVYVDYHTSAKNEGAPVKLAIEKGWDYSAVKADLGELVSGKISGRTDENELILFQSVGVMFEDLVAVEMFYEKLKAESSSFEL